MPNSSPPAPIETLPPDWKAREWRHCIIGTYGSWLYGDSRSFRTRHHREHIVGDYRNPPPPGMYADKLARSQQLLKQPPVQLPLQFRPIVGAALVNRLLELDCYVLCAAVSNQHAHFLVKLLRKTAREMLGKAKQHAWFVARDHGWKKRLWAKRGRAVLVPDQSHLRNVFQYILDHASEGAWTWVRPGYEGCYSGAE